MDSASWNIILTFRSLDDNYLNKNGSDSKESACGSGDLVSVPGLGRFPWRIPWTEEPGRLQSMGLQKVGHDRATNVFLNTLFCSYSGWPKRQNLNISAVPWLRENPLVSKSFGFPSESLLQMASGACLTTSVCRSHGLLVQVTFPLEDVREKAASVCRLAHSSLC